MGKVNGERQYQQKQYLIWTLRELFEIVNGCTHISHLNSSECFEIKFNVKLTFRLLYDFIKVNKYYIFNKQIPHTAEHTACLCEICENAVLLAEGINRSVKHGIRVPSNPHDIVEEYCCESGRSECMQGYMYSLCTIRARGWKF